MLFRSGLFGSPVMLWWNGWCHNVQVEELVSTQLPLCTRSGYHLMQAMPGVRPSCTGRRRWPRLMRRIPSSLICANTSLIGSASVST